MEEQVTARGDQERWREVVEEGNVERQKGGCLVEAGARDEGARSNNMSECSVVRTERGKSDWKVISGQERKAHNILTVLAN